MSAPAFDAFGHGTEGCWGRLVLPVRSYLTEGRRLHAVGQVDAHRPHPARRGLELLRCSVPRVGQALRVQTGWFLVRVFFGNFFFPPHFLPVFRPTEAHKGHGGIQLPWRCHRRSRCAFWEPRRCSQCNGQGGDTAAWVKRKGDLQHWDSPLLEHCFLSSYL